MWFTHPPFLHWNFSCLDHRWPNCCMHWKVFSTFFLNLCSIWHSCLFTSWNFPAFNWVAFHTFYILICVNLLPSSENKFRWHLLQEASWAPTLTPGLSSSSLGFYSNPHATQKYLYCTFSQRVISALYFSQMCYTVSLRGQGLCLAFNERLS